MKRLIALLLSLIMIFSLAACGEGAPSNKEDDPTAAQGDKEPTRDEEEQPTTLPQKDSQPTEPEDTDPTQPEETEPTQPEAPKVDLLAGDSYWVLREFTGDERDWMSASDRVWTDLTLWVDGRARLREIQDGRKMLNEDNELEMFWEVTEEGYLFFYTYYTGDIPYWSGVVTQDGIELNRFGGKMQFRQADMPEETGDLYSPAELDGVWLQVSSEIEGDNSPTMPGWFNSLIFRQGESETLVEAQTGNWLGEFYTEYEDQSIEVLDEPIYSGCGNEKWSVRIGPEAEKSESGYPLGEERYVTLLDQDTLLMQMYFSIDGGPGVSYQTYKKFLPESSDEDVQIEDLEGSDWYCIGFTDGEDQDHLLPEGVAEFYLHLDQYGEAFFTITYEDDTEYSAYIPWILGSGGTLLMNGENFDTDWYAGAVQNANGYLEMFLYYDGGIMWMEHIEGSGGEGGGYDDTLIDLAGEAFAASPEVVLLFYGDGYLDMSLYREQVEKPVCVLAEGPDARQILITNVYDGVSLWIEDGDWVVADIGEMAGGESVIIQLNYTQSEGPELCIDFFGDEYYIELEQDMLDIDGCDEITIG